jgi:hypothetical protein
MNDKIDKVGCIINELFAVGLAVALVYCVGKAFKFW